jgi:hypothetical protein
MPRGLHDTPLSPVSGADGRPSELAERAYRRGRELVERHGVRVADLVWDADEVLWDWAMSGGRLFASVPRAIFGNFGHREWIAVRPGLLELLWGMRHASEELGFDPDLRVWTSGYPWRLWAIFKRIPGFAELLGDGHPDTHPRVFTRPDYVDVVKPLVADKATRRQHLDAMSPAARATIAQQLSEKPHDSGFKIPELAVLAGRQAFSTAKILIDDAGRNVRWFHATGRSAVRVRSVTPRIFGAIPNSAWDPLRFLREVASPAAFEIADALERLYRDPSPRIEEARVTPDPLVPPTPPVVIDVPSEVLWSQWIHPIRELEKVFRDARKKAR